MEEMSVTELDRDLKELKLLPMKILSEDSSVQEVISFLKDNPQQFIGVGNEKNLSGIVSSEDIVHKFSIDMNEAKVSDVMKENVFVFNKSSTVYEVMKTMSQRKLSDLPIVDEESGGRYILTNQIIFSFLSSYFSSFLGKFGVLQSWEPTKIVQAFSEEFSHFITMEDDSALPQNYFLVAFERILSKKMIKKDKTISIGEAWDTMKSHQVNTLILTDFGTKFYGILTAEDIISKVIAKADVSLDSPVTDFLSSDPHVLMYKHPIANGVNYLLEENNKYIIIVDEDYIPLKIISLLEIADHLISKIRLN